MPEETVKENFSEYARAYATTPAPVPPGGGTPCAAACAPFKNSPATYQACCKQHAAAAPAPKPMAKPKPKTATKVYPLSAKPPSVTKLIDYVPNTGSSNFFRGTQQQRPNVTNNYNNYTLHAPPPVVDPYHGSITGDCGTATMECHNYGDRHEDKVDQTGASFEYGGLFLIPNATRHLTLEFGGLPHSDQNDRSGYKVEFNDGKAGVKLWKQEGRNYIPINSAIGGNTNYTARIGSKINVTIRKQDIGPPSAPTGVEINAFAEGQLVGRWRDTLSSPLGGKPPYTGFVNGYRAGFRHDCLKGCCVKSCCKDGESGPSVICGQLFYTALSNLSS